MFLCNHKFRCFFDLISEVWCLSVTQNNFETMQVKLVVQPSQMLLTLKFVEQGAQREIF